MLSAAKCSWSAQCSDFHLIQDIHNILWGRGGGQEIDSNVFTPGHIIFMSISEINPVGTPGHPTANIFNSCKTISRDVDPHTFHVAVPLQLDCYDPFLKIRTAGCGIAAAWTGFVIGSGVSSDFSPISDLSIWCISCLNIDLCTVADDAGAGFLDDPFFLQ